MQVDLKKLKPFGVVLVLGFGILFVILCLNADLGVPERYTPEHEISWYRENTENLQALADELTEKVLPNIEGAESCIADPVTMTVCVHAASGYEDRVRVVLERDFGEGLINVT